MAWHVVHCLLENCRKISTFPGKLWIMVMFAFRMVMIARVGDQVYGDEQDHFTCNTQQPGCPQVCYSRFAPISHLRFWSVMVIITATPPIVFLAYATNIISRHARKKEEEEYTRQREREDRAYALARPQQPNNMSKYFKNLRRRNKKEKKSKENNSQILEPSISSKSKNKNVVSSAPPRDEEDNLLSNGFAPPNYFEESNMHEIPIFGGGKNNRYVTAIVNPGTKPTPIMSQYRPLHHPAIARAYWWQVLIRTVIEVFFLWLQWYLFGLKVDEMYLCRAYPCPQSVECWVSRAQEKTVFLWFMMIVGCLSTILGLAEFWSLGMQRFKVAFGCSNRTKVQKLHKRKPSLSHLEHMDAAMAMDRFSICSLGNSGSSGSTMSSV